MISDQGEGEHTQDGLVGDGGGVLARDLLQAAQGGAQGLVQHPGQHGRDRDHDEQAQGGRIAERTGGQPARPDGQQAQRQAHCEGGQGQLRRPGCVPRDIARQHDRGPQGRADAEHAGDGAGQGQRAQAVRAEVARQVHGQAEAHAPGEELRDQGRQDVPGDQPGTAEGRPAPGPV